MYFAIIYDGGATIISGGSVPDIFFSLPGARFIGPSTLFKHVRKAVEEKPGMVRVDAYAAGRMGLISARGAIVYYKKIDERLA